MKQKRRRLICGASQINEDIVAWIQIPGIGVDYPVVQGEDNEYYLHHTFRKEVNKAGSIFLDYRNRADFTEQRVIIYGHNMKDGSMFHVLRKFQDIDFYREHEEIWLYLPNGSTQVYEIVEYEEVRTTGEVYKMGNKNIEENEIILSTCSSRSDRRLIVKGILKNKIIISDPAQGNPSGYFYAQTKVSFYNGNGYTYYTVHKSSNASVVSTLVQHLVQNIWY